MSKLIDQLIEQKYLKSPRIIEAFKKIKRADFLPPKIIKNKGREFVNQYNAPIPIGYEQTISQPLTVAFMLELLQPQQNDKILDIGSGSGWQTTMLCQIVGPKGFVYAIERIPELKDFGQENLAKAKYGFKNVEFICGDGSKGLKSQAPFDKIIVAASSEKIPQALKDQLKIGGRLVLPIKNSIWLLIKKDKNKFEEKEYPGFVFVPLIKDKIV
ncbi:protein-L-isoaspartate O-methyltransferase [Patescibacteria group bacterium]|nr:protein-L-isoaspartate O-methyltransferase [Patescibacteria group bacterium]MBU1563892.1 protein-L-isoaspartate O-methyltransferase [Patescibacteria group bacterium]